MNALIVALEGSTTIDFSPIINALNSAITPADLIAVIASVIGVGFTFFLMWFGIRKLVKVFTKSLTTGKVSL